MTGRFSRRAVLAGGGLAVLGGCALPEAPGAARADLGAFRLGHVVVVARDARRMPLSRPAEADAWVAALTDAVEARLGGHDGGQLYHLGIDIGGYMLAPAGVPVVASPRSALAIAVSLWDDAAGARVNPEPEQMVVFETLSGGTAVGSGLTRTAAAQMDDLARNAARRIEAWIAENPAWTAPRPADG